MAARAVLVRHAYLYGLPPRTKLACGHCIRVLRRHAARNDHIDQLDHAAGHRDDHAFADVDQTIYSADGEVVLALHVVNLLRRQDAEWRLVASRPYAFPPPPA